MNVLSGYFQGGTDRETNRVEEGGPAKDQVKKETAIELLKDHIGMKNFY